MREPYLETGFIRLCFEKLFTLIILNLLGSKRKRKEKGRWITYARLKSSQKMAGMSI